MGLVYYNKEILREIVDEGAGRLPRRRARQVAGVVFNSRAESCFPHHLHIEVGSLQDALRLKELVLALEPGHLLLELFQNVFSCQLHLLLWNDIVGRGENSHMSQLRLDLPGQGIDLCNPVHLIPEEFYPVGIAAGIGGIDFQHIAADTERTALEIHVVSRVLDVDELVYHLIPVLDHAGAQGDHHLLIVDRASQTVNAGDRSHDNDIASLGEGCGSRVAKLIDLVIDG